MERPTEKVKKDSQQITPTIFPLAIVVGLIVFFITSEEPGGLTGVQGFFMGFSAVILLFVVVGILGMFLESRRQKLEVSQISFRMPGNMFVTQQENEEGLTIHIHVPKQASVKREVVSDR